MPTTYSSRSAVVGIARQTAEGSGASTAKFEIPMGGGFVGPERAIEEFPWTFDSQDSAGFFVTRTGGMLDLSVPLLPKSCVPFIQSALGARSTSGAGPYTHTLTPADSLGFYTWFYKQPGPGDYWTLVDSKTGSWQFNFAPGQPLSLQLNGAGKTPTRSGSKWSTATVVEAPPTDPFFTMIDAVIKFDVDNTTPTTTVHNIGAGNISLNRNLNNKQTDTIGWRYMAEQKRDIGVSFDNVTMESSADINKMFTGSGTGTSVSGATVYGSCELLFIDSLGTAAATRSLKMTLPNVLWTVDQIPSANPAGTDVEYTVTGRASKPASGAALTCVVINADDGTANY